MRIPNLDTSLYVTLPAGLFFFCLGALVGSESIQEIGGLLLLLGLSQFVFPGAYAGYVAIRNRKK